MLEEGCQESTSRSGEPAIKKGPGVFFGSRSRENGTPTREAMDFSLPAVTVACCLRAPSHYLKNIQMRPCSSAKP